MGTKKFIPYRPVSRTRSCSYRIVSLCSLPVACIVSYRITVDTKAVSYRSFVSSTIPGGDMQTPRDAGQNGRLGRFCLGLFLTDLHPHYCQ